MSPDQSQSDERDGALAGDAQRPKNRAARRAERRAENGRKSTKHGSAAQRRFDAIAAAGGDQQQGQGTTAAPSSRQGDRGGDDDDAEAGPPDHRAGDLLVTADEIRTFLIFLGMPEETDPYYLKKIGWPIGKTGGETGNLIASKRRLTRHTEKLTTPAS